MKEDMVAGVAEGRAKQRRLTQALVGRPGVLADGWFPAPASLGTCSSRCARRARQTSRRLPASAAARGQVGEPPAQLPPDSAHLRIPAYPGYCRRPEAGMVLQRFAEVVQDGARFARFTTM